MYLENPTRLGYRFSDSDIEALERHLNSREEAVLLVDETYSFLYDAPPLVSRFKAPQFSHLSFYSADKLCFWDDLGVTWAVGTAELVQILGMYQQTMVYCPITPLVYAFAALFAEFNSNPDCAREFFGQVR